MPMESEMHQPRHGEYMYRDIVQVLDTPRRSWRKVLMSCGHTKQISLQVVKKLMGKHAIICLACRNQEAMAEAQHDATYLNVPYAGEEL